AGYGDGLWTARSGSRHSTQVDSNCVGAELRQTMPPGYFSNLFYGLSKASLAVALGSAYIPCISHTGAFMTACIVGLAHTPFGKLDTESVESLIIRVTKEALADAGIEAADVDEIVLGHFNAGFSAQDFTAALV